jgi:hypothetical protein
VKGKAIDLEDGVQVTFGPDGTYHPGMYWLIPARVETGSVEWPRAGDKATPRPPNGVEHHFAPLAEITIIGGKVDASIIDRRRQFQDICTLTRRAHTH